MTDSPSDHMLQAFLAGRDVECPSCRYNLRDLQGQFCPECGQSLVLRVGLEYPRIRLLITGLIGLACGVGLNGLLMIYAGLRMIVDGFDSFMIPFLAYNTAALAVEGGALAVWLFLWRRIARLPLNIRIILAIACWGLSGVNILLFSMIVS